MSSKSEPPEEVWVKTEPDWDETSGELLTGRVQVKEEVVDLKEEAEWEDSAALYGVSESSLVVLYAGHEVKDELVLGPECLQPADVVFTLYAAQALNAKEQRVPRDCVVRLERVALEALLKSNIHSNTNIATNRDTYVCNVCGKRFALKIKLMEHAVIHIRQSSEREGSTRGVADNAEPARGRVQHRDHTYAKTGCTLAEGNLKHEEIEKAGEQQSSVSRQVHSDTDKDVEVCEMPGVKHLKTADSTKETIPYKCYSSAYNNDIVSRDRKLKGEKPYKCSHCSYTGALKRYLQVHERIHIGVKPYKCSHCSYASARKRDLLPHESKHTGVKPYKCSHCSSSASKDCLRVHVRKHTGEKPYKHVKPYKCSHCSYASAGKRDLLTHESKHTGVKPYKCSHCSYASARKRDLLTHESKHTGVKPYKCSHCSYTSASKDCLRVHERKHTTGEHMSRTFVYV